MRIRWYPKNIVVSLVLLAALALALDVSIEVNRGAIVGLAAIAVCTIVNLMFTVNPAVWGRRRRL